MPRPKLDPAVFWERTERQASGCLLWIGPRSGNYGLWGGRKYAHHEAWERYRGLPAHVSRTVVIRHTCDVQLCVEPTHLVRSTQSENLKDMVAKDRHANKPWFTPEEHRARKHAYYMAHREERLAYQAARWHARKGE